MGLNSFLTNVKSIMLNKNLLIETDNLFIVKIYKLETCNYVHI